MQIFVLGMHRSGTSAISRVLNLMGVYFGAENMSTGANDENQKGFWERRDVRMLSDSILHAADCDWDCIADFDPAAIPEESLKVYRSTAADIVLNLDAHRPWFVKEPRLCLLFPVWRPVLELPVCVHIYRNPLEVAHSLKVRNGIPIRTGLALWEAYSIRALQYSEELPRILVSYLKLMQSPQDVVRVVRDRLSEYGGYDLRMPSNQEIVGFLDTNLYHQRKSVKALRAVATANQLALFDSLESVQDISDLHRVTLPDLSSKNLRSLRRYETTSRNIAERARRANDRELRRQRPDLKTQLVLKSHELDRALAALHETSGKLRQAESSIDHFRDVRSDLKTALALREQRIDTLLQDRTAFRNEVRQHGEARAVLQQELRQRAEEVRQHGEAKAALQQELRQRAEEVRQHGEAKAALQQELRQRDEEVRQHGEAKAALQQELRQRAEEVRQHGEAKAALQQELRQRDEEVRQHGEAKAALQQELRQRDEEVRQHGEAKAALQQELRQRDEEVRQHGEARAALQQELRQRAEEVRQHGEAKAALQQELRQRAEEVRQHGEAKAALQQELRQRDEEVRQHGEAKAALQQELRQRDEEVRQHGEARAALQQELRQRDEEVRQHGEAKAALQQELRQRDEEVRQHGEAKAALQQELRRFVHIKVESQQELRLRAEQLRELRDVEKHLKRGIEGVLGSRRWRLGDAARSLGYRLLFRDIPPGIADTLAKLIDEDHKPAHRGEGGVAAGSEAAQRGDQAAVAPRQSTVRDQTETEGASRIPAEFRSTRQRQEKASTTVLARRDTPNATPGGGQAAKRSEGDTPFPKLAGRKVMTVAVVAWDVGHNPLGRAYLIAEALARVYNVVLIGFQFPRYGNAVWKPLRGARIKPIVIPGDNFPEFQSRLSELASRIDADVVIACKARLPAVQLGLMLKAFRNRPLFVDVDDYELSFFKNRQPLEDLSSVSPEALAQPFEEAWTRYTEQLLPFADELLVSNQALLRKFGGVLIPHARDERRFDPEHVDSSRTRKWLGLSAEHKVIMFVGTPRPHKGLVEVLEAIKACGSTDYRFVVVGTPPDKWFADRLKRAGGGHLHMVPDQPFDTLPDLLSAADLVCLLQDPASEISKYQLPAKVVDAAAMGVPVLATPFPPLDPLIRAGVVEAVSKDTLGDRIDHSLRISRTERERQSRISRQWFLKHASYDTILSTLSDRFNKHLSSPRPLEIGARAFLDAQAFRFPLPPSPEVSGEMDIVVFWKQNDTGLYGRRFEMIMRYLARRPEVRHIALFDRPVSILDSVRKHTTKPTDHRGLIFHRSIVRRWGLEDDKKISHHVFLFNNHATDDPVLKRYPPESGFTDFVASELERLSIDPNEAVFWYYPMLEHISALSRRFKPGLKVVDVVDDHRTWPGRSRKEQRHISDHYREVLAGADVAIASCPAVQKSMSTFSPHVALIPNGCDLDPVPVSINDYRLDRMVQISGPKLGLMGNLEPKTDVVLLKKIALRRPNYHLILIGSTHANPDILMLDALPNVHFFGVVAYPDSKALVAHFDVALIPHLDTDQTRSMHPLKMLVYASQGIPIVSTQIHNLGEFEPFIHVASDHNAFIRAVDEVIDGHRKLDEQALRGVVERNSWDRRIDVIMDLLKLNRPQGRCT